LGIDCPNFDTEIVLNFFLKRPKNNHFIAMNLAQLELIYSW